MDGRLLIQPPNFGDGGTAVWGWFRDRETLNFGDGDRDRALKKIGDILGTGAI